MTSLVGPTLARRRLAAAALAVAVAAAAVAVIGAVSLGTKTAAGAGGGGGCFATTGPVCTFKNHAAFADFSSVKTFAGGGGGGGGDCIFTDAFVQAFESLSMPGRGTSTAVFVSLSTFDVCNNVQIECADNFDPNTGMPVFNGTVQFGLKLTTAALNGTAPMFDACAGGTSFTSTVNVSWQSFGPTSTFINTSHFRSPGFLMNSHFMGVSKQALASGVLTDGTAANRASAPTINADVENDTGGTVTISRS